MTTEEAVVPEILWDLEVWNALLGAHRKGRIRSVTANADLLAELPLPRLTPPLHAVLPLAERRGLSSYDALYLALALQERLPLASLDGRLVAAAGAEGLQVLGRE
ncbi:MAG TPA: type II toxin-antitoxin system VapC family toxin [Planctomycetota bacterium]